MLGDSDEGKEVLAWHVEQLQRRRGFVGLRRRSADRGLLVSMRAAFDPATEPVLVVAVG